MVHICVDSLVFVFVFRVPLLFFFFFVECGEEELTTPEEKADQQSRTEVMV